VIDTGWMSCPIFAKPKSRWLGLHATPRATPRQHQSGRDVDGEDGHTTGVEQVQDIAWSPWTVALSRYRRSRRRRAPQYPPPRPDGRRGGRGHLVRVRAPPALPQRPRSPRTSAAARAGQLPRAPLAAQQAAMTNPSPPLFPLPATTRTRGADVGNCSSSTAVAPRPAAPSARGRAYRPARSSTHRAAASPIGHEHHRHASSLGDTRRRCVAPTGPHAVSPPRPWCPSIGPLPHGPTEATNRASRRCSGHVSSCTMGSAGNRADVVHGESVPALTIRPAVDGRRADARHLGSGTAAVGLAYVPV